MASRGLQWRPESGFDPDGGDGTRRASRTRRRDLRQTGTRPLVLSALGFGVAMLLATVALNLLR